jgi:hypothetical protein
MDEACDFARSPLQGKGVTALNLELEITTTSGGSAKLWEVFSIRAHRSTAPERTGCGHERQWLRINSVGKEAI